MADKEREETEEVEEREDDERDEGEDEDEGFALDAELRPLETEALEQKNRLRKMALRMEQNGNNSEAMLLREMVGTYQLTLDVIRACGAALSEVDDQLGQLDLPDAPGESFLTEDDGRDIHAVIQSNIKLAKEVYDQSPEGDEKAAIGKLLELNRDLLKRIAELSDLSEEELTAAPSSE